MRESIKLIVILTFAFVFVSAGGAATGGKIAGTIKGPHGVPFKAAFVRAENAQTKMVTTVLSDNQGAYYIDELAPGSYNVTTLAIGYKSDPGARNDVKVKDGQTVTVAFAMQKAPVQWNQLTYYQAGMLLPPGPGRDTVLIECFKCHGMTKLGLRADKDGWLGAIGKMKALRVANVKPDIAEQSATYLSTIFGPNSNTPSPSQLPGYRDVKREHDFWSNDALNIVYVDYELTGGELKDRPGTGVPDKYGNIWTSLEGGLSRLNPETSEFKIWRWDNNKRAHAHDVNPTRDGLSVWITNADEDALVRFDVRSEKFDPEYKNTYNGPRIEQVNTNDPWPQFRNAPPEQAIADGAPQTHAILEDLDGNIWSSGRPLSKFNVKTREFNNLPDAPDTYGLIMDKDGTIWASEYQSRIYRQLVKVNPKTLKVTKYTPPGTSSADPLTGACRLVKADHQGYIWCADYFAGTLKRFDPKTETWKVFQIPAPQAEASPYGLGVDKDDNIWYTSTYTDVTGRFDPKTGKFTQYPSPYIERMNRDLWQDQKGRIWFAAMPIPRIGYFRLRSPSETAAAK